MCGLYIYMCAIYMWTMYVWTIYIYIYIYMGHVCVGYIYVGHIYVDHVCVDHIYIYIYGPCMCGPYIYIYIYIYMGHVCVGYIYVGHIYVDHVCVGHIYVGQAMPGPVFHSCTVLSGQERQPPTGVALMQYVSQHCFICFWDNFFLRFFCASRILLSSF